MLPFFHDETATHKTPTQYCVRIYTPPVTILKYHISFSRHNYTYVTEAKTLSFRLPKGHYVWVWCRNKKQYTWDTREIPIHIIYKDHTEIYKILKRNTVWYPKIPLIYIKSRRNARNYVSMLEIPKLCAVRHYTMDACIAYNVPYMYQLRNNVTKVDCLFFCGENIMYEDVYTKRKDLTLNG